MTRTTANLLISRSSFDEIYNKLKMAGYENIISPLAIDLGDIALIPDDEYMSVEESKKFMQDLYLHRKNEKDLSSY